MVRVFVLHLYTNCLKFVGLPLRKIWRTSGLNIISAQWPWPLPLTLKLVRIIARGVDNHPINFSISRTFRSRLIDRHLSDASREFATLTFDLNGHGACCWCGSSCSVCIPSLNFIGLSFVRYCAFTLWVLVGLVTLTFGIWPRNLCALLSVRWIIVLPILVLLGHFVLDLMANTCQTRHVTLWPLTLLCKILVDNQEKNYKTMGLIPVLGFTSVFKECKEQAYFSSFPNYLILYIQKFTI